jgi:hypothetical protein
MRNFILFPLILFLISACSPSSDKHFKLSKSKEIQVEITDFPTDILMGAAFINFLGDYLIFTDFLDSPDKGIHIYHKNTLAYLGSTGEKGEGPGEITRYGEIFTTPNPNEFWMPDFAKLKAFKFHIDSVLMDEHYLPSITRDFRNDLFLIRAKFISDTVAIGACLEALSPSTFRTTLGEWNISKNTMEKFGYDHPELVDKRTNAFFDYSALDNTIVFAHNRHDVLSVLNNKGELKFNIFGENNVKEEEGKKSFFGRVNITKDYIFVEYLGDFGMKWDENRNPKSVQFSKILVFNKEGSLVSYFDTQHEIRTFSVDEENKRIFCNFLDREIPIGYFSYENLL